jgi:rSAM/selenodomain-associated transferase 1
MKSTAYRPHNVNGENLYEAGKTRAGKEKLILFSRHPVPGQTKTRLIPALGPQGAAALQKRMTEMTVETVRSFRQTRGDVDFEIRYADGERNLLQQWLGPDTIYKDQGQGDLGQRMKLAFAESFKGRAARVIIIGADCPAITAEHLNQSFTFLAGNDLVLGPASDGGYYLIGLSREYSFLFDDIEWGSSSVFKDTIHRAAAAGLKTALLAELDDIDLPEDLKNLPKKIQRDL